MEQQLEIFSDGHSTLLEKNNKSAEKAINVSSVPQRSPFRYPGGKTWFVPIFRRWMAQFEAEKTTLIEPFAGGGIISLTAAFEALAKEIIMVELDDEIAAVWDTIINEAQGNWLANQIMQFDLTVENAKKVLESEHSTTKDKAFSTILKNRIFHGGILAGGSGMLKNGEKGKGITSRWYPATLQKRIKEIDLIRNKIKFLHGDAFTTIEECKYDQNSVLFVDPPYFKAGKRLYTHFDVDHEGLLNALSNTDNNFLVTYDDAEEIIEIVEKLNLEYRRTPMRTTHHVTKYELIISNNFEWFDDK